MGVKPPRRPLVTSADYEHYYRQMLIDSIGVIELQIGAVTTPAIAGAAEAANDRFYVKRAGEMVLGSIELTDIPTGVATDAEVTTAANAAQAAAEATAAANLAAHEAAPDPHSQYLTQTEGDARYRELTDAVTYAEITGKPAALALIFSGTGSPEGAVTAGVGSTYHRTDGGAGTSFYVKESGAGNTGWVGK
jgi:hypothetical protein